MQPKTYPASEHDIDHSQIDSEALYVIEKLKRAGHQAYLVGGGVRDLLIKRSPKDFDISTSAAPEQIKEIFRRSCLLIGRRFRLAHIRFGHKIIEVATFRSGENDSGLIVRDNTWGTEEEDVLRRDFTINGLFYDPTNRTVIDYVQGWDDIQKKVLRTIGDPETRFKQDPVRMIRLLKFRARYGLNIEKQTKNALIKCKDEIIKSAPARILEEILRMLESGASAQFLHLMIQAGLLQLIFPALAHFLTTDKGKESFHLLLAADRMNQQHPKKPLDRAVLASCLLFPLLEQEIQIEFLDQGKTPHFGDIILAAHSVIKNMVTSSFSHFPKKLTATMTIILSTQYRFIPLSGKKHYKSKLLRLKEFPFALLFLKLRTLTNKDYLEIYTGWKDTYRQYLRQGARKPRPHHAPLERDLESSDSSCKVAEQEQ